MTWLKNLFKKKNPPLVAIDFNENCIKVFAISPHAKGFQIEGFAKEPLPLNVFKENEIQDMASVASALVLAIERSQIHSKAAAIAISANHIVTRTLEINAQRESQLFLEIQKQLAQFFPYALEEMCLDFQVLGPCEGKSGYVKVMVIACKKQTLASLKTLMTLAGLDLKVVDVQSYAVERVYQYYQRTNPSIAKKVAILEMNAQKLILQFLNGGKTQYIKEHYVENKNWIDADNALAESTRLATRALHYFHASSEFDSLEEIYVTGDMANQLALPLLQENLKTKLTLLNPLQEAEFAPNLDKEMILKEAPTLITCLGLALRSCQDDPTY